MVLAPGHRSLGPNRYRLKQRTCMLWTILATCWFFGFCVYSTGGAIERVDPLSIRALKSFLLYKFSDKVFIYLSTELGQPDSIPELSQFRQPGLTQEAWPPIVLMPVIPKTLSGESLVELGTPESIVHLWTPCNCVTVGKAIPQWTWFPQLNNEAMISPQRSLRWWK